ncbi:MAG: glycosyltransferase [Muribaculaceae bacterium]|nr:glycosyltransferase [Muribaculaceae bacterium]
MRILHVITSLRTGGAEHLMVDLLPRLRDLGHEVELLIFDGTRTPFYDQLAAAGILIRHFAVGGSVYDPRHIIRLVKLWRRERYDIVHTHNTACQLFAAVAAVLCSVVLCTTEHTTSNRRRGWKWYARVDRWMYSRYRRIVCISDQAEANLRQAIKAPGWPSITTIYNGVDTHRFAEAAPLPALQAQLAGCKTAIMVAGFRYQKDHATLIHAFSHLPESYHLLLVGAGEKQQECEALTASLQLQERIHFLGMRTDVPQLLKTADVVVLSSHFEGLSLSSIEGMASGRPFIASDVDGLHEIVAHYGVLFPHGDSAALAQAISRLCENPDEYQAVATRCQQRASQFDISLMATRYHQLYQQLHFPTA